jgi:hypothetical protein
VKTIFLNKLTIYKANLPSLVQKLYTSDEMPPKNGGLRKADLINRIIWLQKSRSQLHLPFFKSSQLQLQNYRCFHNVINIKLHFVRWSLGQIYCTHRNEHMPGGMTKIRFNQFKNCNNHNEKYQCQRNL